MSQLERGSDLPPIIDPDQAGYGLIKIPDEFESRSNCISYCELRCKLSGSCIVDRRMQVPLKATSMRTVLEPRVIR